MDFAIGLLLFTFTLAIYFSYTNNFQNEDKGKFSLMLKDAKSISSSLSLEGYPDDWLNNSVIRIGIADEQNVNGTKLKRLKQINYTQSRTRFATSYDYFVYFTDDNGSVLNINGVCGSGYPLINLSYNIKSAYYFQDSDDTFLLDFMNHTFKADIYEDDIDTLVSNLSKYQFLVLEHPLLSSSEFNQNKDELENYSSRGGLLMVSGELATAATNSMSGADFKKKSGQSQSQRTAIVNNSDTILSLDVGDTLAFAQYYYAENKTGSSNFLRIATFNQTDDNAVSKWKYGNGTIYFFSDFDVSSFSGNFITLIQDLAQSFVEGTCTPVNTTAINAKDLVKTERYLIYNSKIVRMVVYVWQ